MDPETKGTLVGRRILIVEDEVILAMDLQILLENEGCEIVGPVPNVKTALETLSAHRLDAATLDINLNGEISAAVAEALRTKSVPFLLTSGYSDKHTDPAFNGAPLVKKPFNSDDLLGKLATILK